MAAEIREGSQYGLEQHNHNSNKTYIYMKLTDSAVQALEKYLQSAKKTSSQQKSTIRFQPGSNRGVISLPSSEKRVNFGFNISNTHGDHGPQSSFECIKKHRNDTSFESLGEMLYKLQIHANEESYQKTKAKMEVVEKESKRNCAKEIEMGSPLDRKGKGKKLGPSKYSVKKPGYAPGNFNKVSVPALKVNGATVGGSRQTHQNGNGGASVKRKSLRERIIHLLALNPLKKPQLIAKLQQDGMKESERKGLSAILSSVAQFKDNSYHLAKHCWNDVQIDEWPYYDDEQRDHLRRVKQMTEHNGVKTVSPLHPEGNSQHAFPSPVPSNSSIGSPPRNSSAAQKRCATDSADTVVKKPKTDKSRSTPDMHPPQSSHHKPAAVNSDYNNAINGWSNRPKSPDLGYQNGLHNGTSALNGADFRHSDSYQLNTESNRARDHRESDRIHTQSQLKSSAYGGLSNGTVRVDKQQSLTNGSCKYNGNMGTSKSMNFHVNSSNGHGSVNSTPNSSPDSSSGSSCSKSSVPDYVDKYQEITNEEQLQRYRSEFNKEYKEYLNLFEYTKSVAQRFDLLEEKLKTNTEGSDEWNRVMDQILKEYEKVKKQQKYQDMRKRFLYLHEKLTHIKNSINAYEVKYSKAKDHRNVASRHFHSKHIGLPT